MLKKFSATDFIKIQTISRSSGPEVFLGKGALKISSKLTGEHPCRSAISRNQEVRFQ